MPVVDVAKTGDNIKRIRKEKGMTQKDVADMCGVSVQAVAKWGRTCMPTIDAIVIMAHAWGVAIDQIVGVKNN